MTAKKSSSSKVPKFFATSEKNKRTREILIGGFLVLVGLLFFIAFTSYFFTWEEDQSSLNALSDRSVLSKNLLSKLGASISHFFIYKLFGLAAYIIAYLIGFTGFTYFFNTHKEKLLQQWTWGLYYTLWFSLLFGFYSSSFPLLSGVMGFEMTHFLYDYIGEIGVGSLLAFGSLIFIVLHWNITPEVILNRLKSLFEKDDQEEKQKSKSFEETAFDKSENITPESIPEKVEKNEIPLEIPVLEVEKTIEPEEELEIEINTTKEELLENNISQQLVEKYGSYDPTLELSKYVFPTLDLLKDYGDGSITINQEELEANKSKIVETLKNYKIEIAQIKANIGPTVTLYEIVPAAGIRISKIKNLEDDIALSLSALGIRIIAPIPGKGTIGIEVPNQKPSIVSMRSVIASQNFKMQKWSFPLLWGKPLVMKLL